MTPFQHLSCPPRSSRALGLTLAVSLLLSACLTPPTQTHGEAKPTAVKQAAPPQPNAQPNPSANKPAPALPADAKANPPEPAAPKPAVQTASPGPSCERLPTMSNQKKVVVGAAVGAIAGTAIGRSLGGNKSKNMVNGALAGALVGALAGSAFKNQIDVEEQPDGSVRLKIPGSVMFESGRHALSSGFQSTLTSVTQTINRYCDVNVRVVGYTDNVGQAKSNLVLSENRARAVQAHMQSQGFDRARVRIEGRGDADPVASNSTDQGRQLNRRVEVFVFPPAG